MRDAVRGRDVASLNGVQNEVTLKGITAIDNVNTLRWALYYGIYLSWNILHGFPGEEIEDYEQQTRLVKSINGDAAAMERLVNHQKIAQALKICGFLRKKVFDQRAELGPLHRPTVPS